MRTMADLKENQMAARTAAFVRCIDASGNSGVITLAKLLGTLSYLGVNKTDGGGAGILSAGVGIVFAESTSDASKYLIYAYIRKNGENATRIQLAANGLSLGIQNNQGSSVVTGADKQTCIYIK